MNLIKFKEKILETFYFDFKIPPFDGMQNFQRMKFLYDGVIYQSTCQSGVALEIGCFKGCSTVFLAKACIRKGIREIYAIDLFTGTPSWGKTEDTFEAAACRLKDYQLVNYVTLIRSHSSDYNWEKQIDVLHIDGDHEYKAVMADIQKYVPFLGLAGIAIFDDYDTAHPGVMKAVHQLLETDEFQIIATNYFGNDYGSICLKRVNLPSQSQTYL